MRLYGVQGTQSVRADDEPETRPNHRGEGSTLRLTTTERRLKPRTSPESQPRLGFTGASKNSAHRVFFSRPLQGKRPERRTSNIRLGQRSARPTTWTIQTPTQRGLTLPSRKASGGTGADTETINGVEDGLAPIWHNPTLPYWYHPDFVFRSSVVSFRIRLKLEIRTVLQGRRCPDGAGGYVSLSHTCAGVNSSVAAAVPAVV
jgi:hypothetical protein